jgi:hypothetical protein
MSQFRKGQSVWALVEGEQRELVVHEVTSNGAVAQCYWTNGRVRQFVMLFAGGPQKVERPAVPVTQDGQRWSAR